MDIELRNKIVQCYIWIITLYGAEMWALREVAQKHLESFEVCAGEGWRRSVGRIV
jgi:hypothetical protein